MKSRDIKVYSIPNGRYILFRAESEFQIILVIGFIYLGCGYMNSKRFFTAVTAIEFFKSQNIESPGLDAWPWSLVPETTNINYLKAVRKNLGDIDYCITSIQKLKASSIENATGILAFDEQLQGTLTESEEWNLKRLRRFYRNTVKVNGWDIAKRRQTLKSCHEQQPLLFEAFLKMGTEGMEKKIVEYKNEEDILVSYMETLETPLLPEGPIYENYQSIAKLVDQRLSLINACTRELEAELETGQCLKDCEKYEMEYGPARQSFIFMWLLNRVLLILKMVESSV
ncbi:hypothetical protein DFP73DRAFT_624759 [Morchella snyderi]|nr:hypothetical protein DFP73DRAFT_624759 [Morchella snyderi]